MRSAADRNLWVVLYADHMNGCSIICYPLTSYIPANTGVIVQGYPGTCTFAKYRGTAQPLESSLLPVLGELQPLWMTVGSKELVSATLV